MAAGRIMAGIYDVDAEDDLQMDGTPSLDKEFEEDLRLIYQRIKEGDTDDIPCMSLTPEEYKHL